MNFFQRTFCPVVLLSVLPLSVAALPLSDKEDKRPRVFVTDDQGWEVKGRISAKGDQAWDSPSGESRSQTAQVFEQFNHHCDKAVVTIHSAAADYVVLFDRQTSQGLLRRDNKITVFDRQGVTVFGDSTETVNEAVEGACRAIVSHHRKASREDRQEPPQPAASEATPSPPFPLTERSRYATLRDHDGHVWNSLRRDEKLAYLAGHLSALEDLYAQLAVEFDLSKAVSPASELVAIARHEQKVRSAILQQVEQALSAKLKEATHLESSVAELSKYLDEFYEDTSLLKVPIVEAVDVVELERRGSPKEEIFRRKAALRSSAGY